MVFRFTFDVVLLKAQREMAKIADFDENRRFWWKLQILTKTPDFDENRGFWWKLWILMKIVDFDENCGFWWKLWILMKTADFDENHRFWWELQFSGRFNLRNCKNHISNSTFKRTTSNTEIHRFLSEMKDHLPKKVTPIPNWLLLRPFDPIYHCVPSWVVSKSYDLIFVLCTQISSFKTIWPNFIIVYPIDSFQDHMIWFLHCVPIWLFSRPFDLIF